MHPRPASYDDSLIISKQCLYYCILPVIEKVTQNAGPNFPCKYQMMILWVPGTR